MGRHIVAGVVMLAMVAAGGCTAGPSAPSDARSAPSTATPGAPEVRSVAIGDGREMFLECRGAGEPTIILESGIHDASDYWTVSQVLTPAVETPVMDALAQTNRVCRYDRPRPLSEDPDYEKYDVDASFDELRSAASLPEIPLVVLTKTEPFPEFPDGAGMANDDIDGVWQAAQLSLVALLPNTPQVIAHGSIHYIQVTDLVASAARLAIARSTAGG